MINKFRIWFNRNKEKAIVIIMLIPVTYFILKSGSDIIKMQREENSKIQIAVTEKPTSTPKASSQIQLEVKDESIITSQTQNPTTLKKDSNIIDNFINYCTNGNFEDAYELLSSKCKENVFPTIEDFEKNYAENLFNAQKRYSMETWIDDTYKITFKDDILAMGSASNNPEIVDYYTIVTEDSKKRLNINGYIKYKQYNNSYETKNNITITVESMEKYTDYEVYNVTIKNNSNNTICIGEEYKSIYLEGSNSSKYYSILGEMPKDVGVVNAKTSKSINIKFDNKYISNRDIKNMVFTNVILNYDGEKDLVSNITVEI